MTAGYDFWLFDLDGTLVDVDPGYITDVVDAVGADIGYRFSERQALTLWRAIGAPPERRLRQWGVDPARFWAAFHRNEDPAERIEATFLYEDAADIGSLDCPVGLVTHCQPEITRPVLDALDIGDWFDTVICCHDDIGWKPDPGPVEHALGELGTAPTQAGALVGDTAADVGAAWNAGLDGIHVARADPAEYGVCVRANDRVSHVGELFA